MIPTAKVRTTASHLLTWTLPLPLSLTATLYIHCPVSIVRASQRSLIVDDSTLGYGDKGIGELPANTTFELQVEVLEVVRKV